MSAPSPPHPRLSLWADPLFQHQARRHRRRRDRRKHRHRPRSRLPVERLQMRDLHAQHSGASRPHICAENPAERRAHVRPCDPSSPSPQYRCHCRVRKRSTSCACSAQRCTPCQQSYSEHYSPCLRLHRGPPFEAARARSMRCYSVRASPFPVYACPSSTHARSSGRVRSPGMPYVVPVGP